MVKAFDFSLIWADINKGGLYKSPPLLLYRSKIESYRFNLIIYKV